MKKYLYIILSSFCMAFLNSCSEVLEDEHTNVCQTENGYADLTVSMDIPSLKVSSRGSTESIQIDPYNQLGEWTNWEKFVDGALLYHVTLLVINESGTLVGYRDFFYNSDTDKGDIYGTTEDQGENGFYEGYTSSNLWGGSVNTTATTGVAVKATFNSRYPVHGKIEKLTPGKYKLIAVANYAPITASSPFYEEDTYSGLGNEKDYDTVSEVATSNPNGDGDFPEIVSTIIGNFSETDGLANFSTGENGSAFFNYTLNSGTDRVCNPLPQPLVMIREVELQSGTNQVSGLLSRTFARIRLEVRNQSTSKFLDISNLSFAESYASQKAYLFNDVASDVNMFNHFALYDGNEDESLNTKGTLSVTSKDAILPASSEEQRLLANSTMTIFDCYILEGKIGEKAEFAYSFDATYKAEMADGDVSGNYTIHGFSKDDEAEAGLLDFYLFIRSGTNNESTLLKVDENTNTIVVADSKIGDEGESGSDSGLTLAPEYIWQIVLEEDTSPGSISGDQVLYATGYLRSASTGLYLQPNDGTNVLKLGTKPSVPLYFNINFQGQDEKGTVLCKGSDEKYYYIETTTGTDGTVTASWDSIDNIEDEKIPSTTTTTETSSLISDLDVNSVMSRKPNEPGEEMDSSYDFQILTFETIDAEEIDPIEGTVKNHVQISNSDGTTTTKREIVRNDFFRGIIPITVSE